MMKPPKGMLKRMIATRSRSLNSTHFSVLGQGHGLHPSFWSAKYNHHEGRNPIRPMARNHNANAVTTAFVQVHSKSLTNLWKRRTAGWARSFTPCGMNLAASFTLKDLPRQTPADYIGGPRSPSNIDRRDGPSGRLAGAGRLVKLFTSITHTMATKGPGLQPRLLLISRSGHPRFSRPAARIGADDRQRWGQGDGVVGSGARLRCGRGLVRLALRASSGARLPVVRDGGSFDERSGPPADRAHPVVHPWVFARVHSRVRLHGECGAGLVPICDRAARGWRIRPCLWDLPGPVRGSGPDPLALLGGQAAPGTGAGRLGRSAAPGMAFA